ncbi:MAG: hypothetical protein FWG98_06920 [Candidatus Cloacimonetes bacterium]|nr:hypothetical protein [Candidatus Cloacimonadota bacterium]
MKDELLKLKKQAIDKLNEAQRSEKVTCYSEIDYWSGYIKAIIQVIKMAEELPV